MTYIEAEFTVTLKARVPVYPEGECLEIFNPDTLKIETYAYPCVNDQFMQAIADRLLDTGIKIQGDFEIIEIKEKP